MKKRAAAILMSITLALGSVISMPAYAAQESTEESAEETAASEEEGSSKGQEEAEEADESSVRDEAMTPENESDQNDADDSAYAEDTNEDAAEETADAEEAAEPDEEDPAEEAETAAEEETVDDDAEAEEDSAYGVSLPENTVASEEDPTAEEALTAEEGTEAAAEVVKSGSCGESAYYSLSGTTGNLTLSITGSGDMRNYYLSNTWTSSPWDEWKKEITNLSIAEGITSIGDYSFYGFSKIPGVKFPNSLKKIGNYAFHDCDGISNLKIPGNVESIGKSAFGAIDNLSNVTLGNGVNCIGDFAFSGCENLLSVNLPESLEEIGRYAFSSCKKLGEASIPESIEVINEAVFLDCSALTAVNVPTGVTRIEKNAFSGCSALPNVDLPDNLSEIGAGAFALCSALPNVDLPDDLTKIGRGAFSGCSSFTHVHLPENVTVIPDNCFFRCTNLKSIDIPDGVTSIGTEAFRDCSSLNNVRIPKRVTQINAGTFEGCSSLNKINILGELTVIYLAAFKDCSSLEHFTIKEGVKRLCMEAFRNCSSLRTIRIPKSLEEIAGYAFTGCDSLQDVYYASGEEDWKTLTDPCRNTNLPLVNANIHFNSLITGTIEMEPKILRTVGETFTISAVYKGQSAVTSASVDSDAGEALQVGEVDIWEPVNNGGEIETDMYFQVTAVKKGRYNLTLTTDDGTEATVTVEVISNDIADAEVQLDGVYKNENGYDCFEHTGSGILPTVAKVTLDGIDLVVNQDFTISYGENTDAGYGTIELWGTGKYEGINRVTFIILPPRVSGLRLRDDICKDETHDSEHIHGKIGVEWDKVSSSNGYYIEISRYEDFHEIATEKEVFHSNNTLNYEDLLPREAGSEWYVRAAAFITMNGKELAGEWSDPLPVTICHHFLLNRDTNQFSHNLQSFYKGEWVTKEDGTKEYVLSEKAIYSTSEEYYNRLVEGYSDPGFHRYRINKKYLEEWEGSCHGMSTAMALSGFGKKLDGVETVFWNCEMPKDNIALRNMINYYQLAYNCYPYTKEAMSGVYKVRELVYSNEVALHDLLQSLAEEGMRSEREGKAFVLSMAYNILKGSHSVVVYGGAKESDTRYRLKVFDMNWFDNTVWGDLEEEEIASTELIIDLANDTFSCELPSTYPDVVISENNYFYISYLGIDDLHGDNAIPLLRTKSVPDKTEQDFATLEVSAVKNCTITNAAGETLNLEEGSVTGTMAVYDVRVTGEKTLYYEFKVDRSDSFTLSNMQSEISITADIGHKFHTATANGADTIRLSEGKVEILGSNYSYEAGLSTGLSGADMVICSGHASNDLVLEAAGETAEFRTEGENTCKFRFINGVSQEIREYTNPEHITVTDTDAAGFAEVAADGSEEIIGVVSDDPWGTGDSTTHSGNFSSTVAWKLDKDGVITVFGKGAIPNSSSPEWQDYKDDIQKIVLRDGITSVGSDAFKDCKSCQSVSIPESVSNIGKSAFSGCTALEELDWMKAPKIASIRDEAFLDCDSLVSVVIPEGVITLGGYAFARCDRLKSVIIPDTVTSSGDYIFAENGSLENVQMGTRMRWNIRVGVDSAEQHYPEGLFSNCPSLKTVTIPEGHREIGTCEYENCQNLQSITLPKTLKKIKDNAFKNCRNLTTVIFNGTKEEWKALTIGSGNDYLKRLRVECSDGPLMLVTSLSASLPRSTYTYAGKAITPEATLKNGSTMLKKGTDYAVSYTNNKNVGKATVTITGKGAYWGTVKKTFTIRPKGTGINYLTTGDKRFTVRWNKQATQTTGYQIQCCKNKTFASGTKLVTVAGTSNLSKTVTVAKAGAVYYVRVRTYKKTGTGALYYSAWSAVKSVKTNAAGPKGTTIASLTPGSKRFTVKWNKQATKTTGYQIQYCKEKTFKTGAKLLTVAGASKLSKTVTVAKSGAVYYVRIRTYQKSGTGATYYSGWSAVRSVKTK